MVIQRIQSVYLLLAGILMAVYSFLDVAFVNTVALTLNLYNASVISFILSLLVSCLSIITIFKFKNLKLQMALCSSCLIILFAQFTVLLIEVFANYDSVNFFIANIIPFVVMFLLILSIKGIKKDKKLLSSYDRIR